MKSRPASPHFGLEFYNVDLSKVTNEELDIIREAQNEHGVVFFRDQHLTPSQHLHFSKRCGEIVVNKFFETLPGHDQIAMVRKEPKHATVVGGVWHTDHSYEAEPAKGSILFARQVPNTGGDTLFANMYAAYTALPDEMKVILEGLRAVHTVAHKYEAAVIQAKDDRFPNGTPLDVSTSVHPVVIAHPDSGKKALYINPDMITHFEGWTKEQSSPLLNYLFAHCTRDEFVMRFQWKVGSIAFWDNRATLHCACNDYPTEVRIMHRVTLRGCPLKAPKEDDTVRSKVKADICSREQTRSENLHSHTGNAERLGLPVRSDAILVSMQAD